MPEISHNEGVSRDFYLMKVKAKNTTAMGQFYMLRAWEDCSPLPRPISVFDADGQTISFLYRVVGKGTEIFATLKPGDEITLDGSHGGDFPEAKGTVTSVGDGVGTAPLYLTTKEPKELDPDIIVDIYLRSSDEALLVDLYEKVADKVTVDIEGFATDDIGPSKYDCIMTCGSEIIMRILYKKCKSLGVQAPIYVSMENRMACRIGACLVCIRKASTGNKKACKDSPVTLGSEVFGNE